MTGSLALAAVKVALTAAGGYSLIKHLAIDPLLASTWYATKAPSWLKLIVSVVAYVFTRPSATAKAEAAGAAAVKAKPATGAAPGEFEQF